MIFNGTIEKFESKKNSVWSTLSLFNNVAAAAGGEEAVEYLKQNAVDLVVLDMIMAPGMDGLDTYAKILETCPNQ